MRRIFIDVNVFEDVIRRRDGWRASEETIDAVHANKLEGWISALTIPILYFHRLAVCDEKTARKKANEITSHFNIFPLTKKIIEEAITSQLPEFEDNIQLFSALKAEAEVLITRNKSHYIQDEINILNPEELLEVIEDSKKY